MVIVALVIAISRQGLVFLQHRIDQCQHVMEPERPSRLVDVMGAVVMGSNTRLIAASAKRTFRECLGLAFCSQ